MARPGVAVVLRDTPSLTSLPTDTGVAFVAGLTDKGPSNKAQYVQSLNEFVTLYGDRQTYSVLYDWVDEFFREGGYKLYIGRVVGPAATSGTKNIVDAGAAISLVATAIGPGAWSANYKVAVIAGSGAGLFKIQVTDAANVVLEDSGDLIDNQAAVNWSAGSKYIRLALGASANDPAVAAAAALSAGTDDRTNIVDAQWLTAYNLFTSDLGPGQVVGAGRTGTAAWAQLTAHAAANNRVAILDGQNIATVATLQADPALVNSRYAAMFAPWIIIPPKDSSGANRTVPPSALIAGLIARNDPVSGTNRPAAGNAGKARFVIDLSQAAWTETERQALNGSGINVIRRMFGGIRSYGYRSTVNAVNDANWLDFANARLFMQMSAEFAEMGENFMFSEIDGQNGSTVNGFHDGLAGICMAHYINRELFGNSPEEAFNVDTGPGVNTLATIANLELHAVVAVKMAPMAEYVYIEVVKRLVSEAVV